MENVAKTRINYNATTTAILSSLIGPEFEVNRAPQHITPEMPFWVAEANRVLWERWELAALALCNLRSEIEMMDSPRLRRINGKAINNLLRRFPNIDALVPASSFEPEYDEQEVYH